MSIKDIIKSNFLDKFATDISLMDILFTLGYTLIISFIVYLIYKYTTKNVIYSKKFNVTMSLMSIVTAAVVLAIQSNVVVSLGMVGALSIVRFRTAVKEPRDLLFLFWSISNGIIIGAQLYEIALVLLIVLSAAMIIFKYFPEKNLPFLLVLNLSKECEKIEQILNKNKVKYTIKSKNIQKNRISIIYEINMKQVNNGILKEISKIDNVKELNLISQNGESQY